MNGEQASLEGTPGQRAQGNKGSVGLSVVCTDAGNAQGAELTA